MAIFSAAGSKFQLCADLPLAYNAAGFNDLTWTDVGEVTSIGEFGANYNVIEHLSLADKRTRKFSGSYNNGSMSVEMAFDALDSGQLLALDIMDTGDECSVAIRLRDGSRYFSTGIITSFRRNVGTTDTMVTATVNVELNGDIVERLPTA